MENIHMLWHQSPSSESGQLESEQDIEIVLLAAAGAIQRLVAERNVLRKRTVEQERELAHFRRQSTLIHDSYRSLTSEFVKQFHLVDSAVSDLVGEPPDQAGAGTGTPEQELAEQIHGSP